MVSNPDSGNHLDCIEQAVVNRAPSTWLLTLNQFEPVADIDQDTLFELLENFSNDAALLIVKPLHNKPTHSSKRIWLSVLGIKAALVRRRFT